MQYRDYGDNGARDPSPELQAYFANASYPADLLARAKEIAKTAGY